jgi:hypothetical protein
MSTKKILSVIIAPILVAIFVFILDEVGIITPGRESWGAGDTVNILYAIPGMILLFVSIPMLFKQSYLDWSNKVSGWKWKLILTTPILIIGSLFTFPLFFLAIPIIALGLLLSVILSIKYFLKSYRGGFNSYNIALLIPLIAILIGIALLIMFMFSLRTFSM